MGVDGQCHAAATLPLGKTQYPFYRRLGEPQGWSGQVWKISPPTRIRLPTSGIPRGGVCVFKPPPPEIPKVLHNHAKLNPIVKTVKNC